VRLEDLFIWDKTTSTKHWMELEEENLNSLHFHWGMEMNSLLKAESFQLPRKSTPKPT
jgi:hypothetical protein